LRNRNHQNAQLILIIISVFVLGARTQILPMNAAQPAQQPMKITIPAQTANQIVNIPFFCHVSLREDHNVSLPSPSASKSNTKNMFKHEIAFGE